MKKMKSAFALLLSLGLLASAAPLQAEDTTKSGSTTSQGSASTDKEKNDKGATSGSSSSGAEPECN